MAKQTLLSRKILELRKGHRMTQTDLAQKVGVSTTAISQFEKGVSRPSLDTLDKLSAALGEDISRLYPHIGEYPIATADDNTVVSITFSKYNQPKWEYLRRNEEAWPEWAKKQENPLPYPVISLPPQLLEEGNHRVFPLAVRSMEPTFGIGDLLLFTLLEPDDWGSIDAYSTEESIIDQLPVYAVEVRGNPTHYLPIGRLTVGEDSRFLICNYDNKSAPTHIPIDEVHEIWKFRWSLSRRYKNPSQGLLNRIKELEEQVRQLNEIRNLQKELSDVRQKAEEVPRTFRDRLREIIISYTITEDSQDFNVRELASDSEVRAKYISEYGPIKDGKDEAEYLNIMQPIILSLVRELESQVRAKRDAKPTIPKPRIFGQD